MEEDLFDIGLEIPNPADLSTEEVEDSSETTLVDNEQEPETEEQEDFDDDSETADTVADVSGDNSNDIDSDSESSEDDTPESIFYQFLVENKFIDKDDEFDGSQEKLSEYMNNIGYYAFNNVADSLGEDGKNLLKFALSLGEDATKDRLQEFFSVRANIPDVDFEDNDEVVAFLKDYYIATNQYDGEDLDDRIEFLQSKGKLKEYAEKHYDDLLKNVDAYEQQQIQEEQKKQEAKQALFNNVREELMSYDWSIDKKKQVAEKLSNKEFRRVNTMIQNSPKALIQLADLYTYFDEEKGEFDLSNLIDKRTSTRSASKKLDNIEKNSFSSSLSKIKNVSRTKKGKGGVYFPTPILDEE